MQANRVFAKQVLLDAVEADPHFLERVDELWLERKWAYACGVTGEERGEPPRIVHRDPVIIEVPGAEEANDVVYVSARGGALHCLERTLDASMKSLSETEGAYAIRGRDKGAFMDVIALDLARFRERLGPAPTAAPAGAAVESLSKPEPIGAMVVFGLFGMLPGAMVGAALYAYAGAGGLLFWACVVLGALVGALLGRRYMRAGER